MRGPRSIKSIFGDALAQRTIDRSAFVAQACGGDDETDIRSSLNLAGTFGPLEITSRDSKPLLTVSESTATNGPEGTLKVWQ